MDRSHKNIKNYLLSGTLFSIRSHLTGFFLIAFALLYDAPNTLIGFLGAAPYIAHLLGTYYGAKLLEYVPRTKYFLISATLSRFLWVIPALIPIIKWTNPLGIIAAVIITLAFLETLRAPAWTSIVGEIIPAKKRGEIFGKRLVYLGIGGLLTSLLAGWYLNGTTNPIKFSAVFILGAIFGLIELWPIKKMKLKKGTYKKHHHTLSDLFHPKPRLKKYLIASSFFYFSASIASPFFAVYMLTTLDLSYFFFSFAMSILTLTGIISYHAIGKLSDQIGDRPIVIVGSLATTLVPLMFLFIHKENVWLLIPTQIISGLAWATTNLALNNLFFDFTTKIDRPIQTATYRTIMAIPLIIGPLLGGWLADNATIIITGIPFVFALSALLRAISSLSFLNLNKARGTKGIRELLFTHSQEWNIHPDTKGKWIKPKNLNKLRKKLYTKNDRTRKN